MVEEPEDCFDEQEDLERENMWNRNCQMFGTIGTESIWLDSEKHTILIRPRIHGSSDIRSKLETLLALRISRSIEECGGWEKSSD